MDQDDLSYLRDIYSFPSASLLINKRKILLLAELSIRAIYFGYVEVFDEIHKRACEFANFDYSLSGVVGIRRKFQSVAIPQLIVKTKSEGAFRENVESRHGNTEEPRQRIKEEDMKSKEKEEKKEKEEEKEKEEKKEKEAKKEKEEEKGKEAKKEKEEEKGKEAKKEKEEEKGKEEEKEKEEEKGKEEEKEKEEVFLEDEVEAIKEKAETSYKVWGLNELNPDNDIFEAPLIQNMESNQNLNYPLNLVETILLLNKCFYIAHFTLSNDPLNLEEINAYVSRCVVLLKTKENVDFDEECQSERNHNWLVYSYVLYIRSLAEAHRSKTVDRASFQLNTLLEQFNDTQPSATHRLLYVHQLCYPTQWEMKRELADRMMKLGCTLTAFNMFSDLMMWEDAIDCLIIADRRGDAKKILEERLKINETPYLLCTLGDLNRDPVFYEKAWELSEQRYARAQRSLGSYYFKKKNYEKSAEAYMLSLSINTLNTNAWFICGCSQLLLQKYDEAILCFSRVVCIEPDNAESWSNLAASNSKINRWKVSYSCIKQAVKHKRTCVKIWNTYIVIALKNDDLWGIIYGLKQFIVLNKKEEMPIWPLAYIRNSIVDAEKRKSLSEKLIFEILEFFEYVTQNISNDSTIWKFYSHILFALERFFAAFQASIKQIRVLNSDLSANQCTTEKGNSHIEDMINALHFLIDVCEIIEGLKDTYDTQKKSVFETLSELELTVTSFEKKVQGNLFVQKYQEKRNTITEIINEISGKKVLFSKYQA